MPRRTAQVQARACNQESCLASLFLQGDELPRTLKVMGYDIVQGEQTQLYSQNKNMALLWQSSAQEAAIP